MLGINQTKTMNKIPFKQDSKPSSNKNTDKALASIGTGAFIPTWELIRNSDQITYSIKKRGLNNTLKEGLKTKSFKLALLSIPIVSSIVYFLYDKTYGHKKNN